MTGHEAECLIRAAAALSGDLQTATVWFHSERLQTFDGKTAEELVLEGRGCAVLRYLQSLQVGVAG